MAKLKYTPGSQDAQATVRQVVMRCLKVQPDLGTMQASWSTYLQDLVEIDTQNADKIADFDDLVADAIWDLMLQGVLAPGSVHNTQSGLPHFHRTPYGKQVIDAGEFTPHDPDNYLGRLEATAGPIDATVRAYVQEALHCFHRGLYVAATVMLGVASERVFLMLSEAVLNALANANDKLQFQPLCEQNRVKGQAEWLAKKYSTLPAVVKQALPNDISMAIAGIFNTLRKERNENGHPGPVPPNETRDTVSGYFSMFPGWCIVARDTIGYLAGHQI